MCVHARAYLQLSVLEDCTGHRIVSSLKKIRAAENGHALLRKPLLYLQEANFARRLHLWKFASCSICAAVMSDSQPRVSLLP